MIAVEAVLAVNVWLAYGLRLRGRDYHAGPVVTLLWLAFAFTVPAQVWALGFETVTVWRWRQRRRPAVPAAPAPLNVVPIRPKKLA